MREGAVRPVLDAVSPVVGVVHAHARLVVLEVVAPLSVTGGAVEEGAAGIKKSRFVWLISGKCVDMFYKGFVCSIFGEACKKISLKNIRKTV